MPTLSYTNTPTSPVTGARALAPEPINYVDDWRVISEKPGEVVIANLHAPVLQPEKVRIAISDVADVYKGSDVDAPTSSSTAPVAKKGVSILIQNTGVYQTVDDSSIPYPYSAHLVLKLPLGAEPDPSFVIDIMERLLGHLYDTKQTTISSRVASLIRGATTPPEL